MSDLLTGILFTHNCVKFDYCFEAAIESLAAFCDKVLVMDCESDDGTVEALVKLDNKHKHLELILHQPWEVAPDHTRLAVLYNQLRERVKTPWYFELQADEVVHEDSFTWIKQSVENQTFPSGVFVRRLNFWRDPDHYISFSARNKPCGDEIVRLARQDAPVAGDAESVEPNWKGPAFKGWTDKIRIFHYGLVRDGFKLVDKCLDMQSWFWGKVGKPDRFVVESKAQGKPFNYDAYDNAELVELTGTHPKFALDWIEQRRKK
jgi:glycosyltransferase involved in cell wall biosynthesis